MAVKSNDFDAVAFRQKLHQHPELSGHEISTAKSIAQQLTSFGLSPICNVGGHGVICEIRGQHRGETTLLRADFDAVPVQEKAAHHYVSNCSGVMHACGHDGHTTSLLKVAHQLSQTPPQHGKVILLFQPAEEIGTGAAAMLAEPILQEQVIDNVFAYHNLPGQPRHQIVIKQGTFSCASSGVCIELDGKTSHAAYPENGVSPVKPLIELMQFLQHLPDNYPEVLTLVTIVHAQLGEEAFGVSAGSAKLMATLRSECNDTFHCMTRTVKQKITQLEQSCEVKFALSWHEPFKAAVNSSRHVELVRQQAKKLGLAVTELEKPMRWSEDVAEFLQHADGALFGIGSGIDHPELHNPDYDFPDDILPTASAIMLGLIHELHS